MRQTPPVGRTSTIEGRLRLTPEGRRKLLRLMAGEEISGRKLADVAGYKVHGYMQRLLAGEKHGIDQVAADRIASFFNLDTSAFFVPSESTDSGPEIPQQSTPILDAA